MRLRLAAIPARAALASASVAGSRALFQLRRSMNPYVPLLAPARM